MDRELLEKRIMYLKAQVAAAARLDGWSLKGAEEELAKIELAKQKEAPKEQENHETFTHI